MSSRFRFLQTSDSVRFIVKNNHRWFSQEADLRRLAGTLPYIEIAYNRDLGCSPRSVHMLRYFDIMSPRDKFYERRPTTSS